jgi:hypothetical protein
MTQPKPARPTARSGERWVRLFVTDPDFTYEGLTQEDSPATARFPRDQVERMRIDFNRLVESATGGMEVDTLCWSTQEPGVLEMVSGSFNADEGELNDGDAPLVVKVDPDGDGLYAVGRAFGWVWIEADTDAQGRMQLRANERWTRVGVENGPTYEAVVAIGDQWRALWARPRFTQAEVQRMVDADDLVNWSVARPGQVVVSTETGPLFVEPDERGLYPIGVDLWQWTEQAVDDYLTMTVVLRRRDGMPWQEPHTVDHDPGALLADGDVCFGNVELGVTDDAKALGADPEEWPPVTRVYSGEGTSLAATLRRASEILARVVSEAEAVDHQGTKDWPERMYSNLGGPIGDFAAVATFPPLARALVVVLRRAAEVATATGGVDYAIREMATAIIAAEESRER